MYRIYKRNVVLTKDPRYFANRFANPVDSNGNLTNWAETGLTNSDPDVLFKMLIKGFYDEYNYPMKGNTVPCEEYQVVNDSGINSTLWLCDFVINNSYKEPKFK